MPLFHEPKQRVLKRKAKEKDAQRETKSTRRVVRIARKFFFFHSYLRSLSLLCGAHRALNRTYLQVLFFGKCLIFLLVFLGPSG
jgi:hypothetical protein